LRSVKTMRAREKRKRGLGISLFRRDIAGGKKGEAKEKVSV